MTDSTKLTTKLDNQNKNSRECADSRPVFPHPLRKHVIWPALGVALLGLLLNFFSEPLYLAIKPAIEVLPLGNFLSAAKYFPKPSVILSICVLIWVLDTKKRNTIGVFLIALLLSGAINGVIKETTRKSRPEYSVEMSAREQKLIESMKKENPDSTVDPSGRVHWLFLNPNTPFFRSHYQSFPSGHTNTAIVMAAFLSLLYPRLIWFWFLWAVGCGLSRIESSRHFLEDVLFGGALGWITAHLVFSWKWPAKFGNWLEQKISRWIGGKQTPKPAEPN